MKHGSAEEKNLDDIHRQGKGRGKHIAHWAQELKAQQDRAIERMGSRECDPKSQEEPSQGVKEEDDIECQEKGD